MPTLAPLNSTDCIQPAITSHFPTQLTFTLLYSAIFLLGLAGNLLVCRVVYANRAMHTTTNLFITNLALADLLLCALCVPFTPLYTFQGRWAFGALLCHLIGHAQAASVYISTLTLTAIAVDRFFVILHPLRRRMRTKACLWVLLAIWVFSVLVTLPYGVWIQQVQYSERCVVCEENWPYEHFQVGFGLFTLVLQFIVPFLVIRYCYARIAQRLNERAKAKPGSKSARREEADREKKRRTNRMLIAMVTIFGVCWFPLNLNNLLSDVFEKMPYYHLRFFVTHCLAMSSTCYNPFLYAWLNENFRKEFRVMLPAALRSRRYCSGDERTMDTLLQSGGGSPKQLEPRQPIVEPIVQTQEFNL